MHNNNIVKFVYPENLGREKFVIKLLPRNRIIEKGWSGINIETND